MSKEKDILVTQIQEQKKHAIEEESLNKRYNDLGAQARLDAFRSRYKETRDKSDHMNRKFEEASKNLKDQLATKGSRGPQPEEAACCRG
ncbi:PREDICTED: kinesin, partial [Prunus dulcis]